MERGADTDRLLLRPAEGGRLLFWCPGCKCCHFVDHRWTVTGAPEAPTANPSVLLTSGHYIPGHAGACWCTFNEQEVAAGREPSGFACYRCHLFIREGRLEFLSDCTHALAGQTVPMEPP